MIYSILEHFFPGEDFVPQEDFVLCIFSPLLFTFSCGIDYILQDFVPGGFCPGRILSQEYFALYLCILMVTLMIYGILEYFFPGRILSREKILSSAYSIRYYRHSFVAMIVFGRILSREDFVLYLWNSMVSLIIYGILEYFFPREDFVPEEDFVLSIFSPLLLTFTCGNDCTWEAFVPGGFCPVPMQLNGQLDDLWYFRVFFSPGGFCPGGGFCPHHILSITTYTQLL